MIALASARPAVLRSIAVAALALPLLLGGARAQSCEPRVLSRSDADEVHEAHRALVEEPGRYQRQLPEVASGFFSPLLCAAVERVVYVEDAGEPSETMGWVRIASHNDLVHVDGRENHADETDLDPDRPGQTPALAANVWAAAIDTLVHEGTHAATHLLHSQIVPGGCLFLAVGCDEPTDASQWRPDAIEVARQASRHARLGGGFRAEWERMHAAFVDGGMAAPYGSGGLSSESADRAIAEAGVMTPYGLTSASEDIAEMVAKALVDPSVVRISGEAPNAAREDRACRALQGADAVQSWNAAVVAKLGFLADVGLIVEDVLEACSGGLEVDTRGADGFHTFLLDGTYQSSYTRDVEVSMGLQSSNDRVVFALDAWGTASFGDVDSPVRLRLLIDLAASDADLDRVSWPRGLYWLGEGVTAFTLAFENEEVDGASFIATGGPILITRASADLIEGSLVVQRGMRLSPTVPLVPDELRRVTFRATSSR
jgi:hypothetical protein